MYFLGFCHQPPLVAPVIVLVSFIVHVRGFSAIWKTKAHGKYESKVMLERSTGLRGGISLVGREHDYVTCALCITSDFHLQNLQRCSCSRLKF